jgi:hypothetical protein
VSDCHHRCCKFPFLCTGSGHFRSLCLFSPSITAMYVCHTACKVVRRTPPGTWREHRPQRKENNVKFTPVSDKLAPSNSPAESPSNQTALPGLPPHIISLSIIQLHIRNTPSCCGSSALKLIRSCAASHDTQYAVLSSPLISSLFTIHC